MDTSKHDKQKNPWLQIWLTDIVIYQNCEQCLVMQKALFSSFENSVALGYQLHKGFCITFTWQLKCEPFHKDKRTLSPHFPQESHYQVSCSQPRTLKQKICPLLEMDIISLIFKKLGDWCCVFLFSGSKRSRRIMTR